MEIIHGLESFPKQRLPVVLALGTFDGVHRGHQATIASALTHARALRGRSAVCTFDPHPRAVLDPKAGPFLLTTLDERLELLAGLGPDLTVIVRFDDTFRQMPAEDWARALKVRTEMAAVVCGPTYTFGRDRGGTASLLREFGRRHAFEVWVTEPVYAGGIPVSSTRIRDLLRAGQVPDAASLLGRWYTLRGPVVAGDGRGRDLGFPTANLQLPPAKLIPPAGIYAAYARSAGGVHHAAVSIGTRPTFGPGPVMVEAYLLDFTGDLYGTPLELHLAARLRDEQAFSSVKDLVRQIADDVTAVPQALEAAEARTGLGLRASNSPPRLGAPGCAARSPAPGKWVSG